MQKKSKIYVAGHAGLLGRALCRVLKENGFKNIITKEHSKLDLTVQSDVNKFIKLNKPEYIFLAAAKVGGIYANKTYPAEFLYENIMIQSNVIQAAHEIHAKKLLFYGSACSYPRDAGQPISEDSLLAGSLEPTNEAYAIAKISGIKMCQFFKNQYGDNFICAMPTNMYGPHDNFDIKNAHVIPALIRRFHEAKVSNKPDIGIWGSGRQKREFIFVDDVANASIFLMKQYNSGEFINIGTGTDVSIKELACLIKDIVGYKGRIKFDTSKPDGAPRKVLDITKMKKIGIKSKTSLTEGIKKTYNYYLNM